MPTQPQDFKKKKNKATSASAWKKKSNLKPVLVELPSGGVMRVKRIPMPTLLASGVFPDSLASMVSEKIGSEDSKKPKTAVKSAELNEVQEAMKDPSKMADIFRSFDRVVVLAAVEPVVHSSERKLEDGTFETIPDDERDDDLLYADEIDLEDKSFLFQYCVGGTEDLEEFREESDTTMASLENESGVQDAS